MPDCPVGHAAPVNAVISFAAGIHALHDMQHPAGRNPQTHMRIVKATPEDQQVKELIGATQDVHVPVGSGHLLYGVVNLSRLISFSPVDIVVSAGSTRL